MAAPEFIYVNEQAVRVSGWQHSESTGSVELVVIVRGESDRDHLLDQLSREPVMIRVGSASAIPMEVRSLETTSTGSGPTSSYRLKVALWPEGSPVGPATSSPEEDVDPIVERLDRIIEILTELRDELRER